MPDRDARRPDAGSAERLLRERERQLAESQALAHVGSWEWDIPADRVTWSEELYRIYGVPLESPAGYAEFVALVHPDDRARVERIIAQGLAERRIVEYEWRVVRPDGEIRHVLGRNGVVADAAGQPVRMYGTSLDITDRKAADENQQYLLRELQTALAQVKTLHGMIRICSHCKRVLTGEGTWQQIESYVRDHSETDFSHGICPECARDTWTGVP